MNPIQKVISNLITDPPARAEYVERIQKQEARERRLEAEIRNNCAEAIQDIGSALRFPRVSASELEIAIKRMNVALAAAKEFDV